MRSSASSRSVPSAFMKIGAWNISPTFSSSVMRASSSSTCPSIEAVLIGTDLLMQAPRAAGARGPTVLQFRARRAPQSPPVRCHRGSTDDSCVPAESLRKHYSPRAKEHQMTSKVVALMSMSLDGYVADVNDG